MTFYTNGIFVDVEGTGQNFEKNPDIEISAVVMSYDNINGFVIHDMIDLCIKMNTKEENDKKRDAIINRYSSEICLDIAKDISNIYFIQKK